jgi:hypothetical protein
MYNKNLLSIISFSPVPGQIRPGAKGDILTDASKLASYHVKFRAVQLRVAHIKNKKDKSGNGAPNMDLQLNDRFLLVLSATF